MNGYTEETVEALFEVAEAAATLFRPPYRRLAGVAMSERGKKEQQDFTRLHKALCNPDCLVEIGEELT